MLSNFTTIFIYIPESKNKEYLDYLFSIVDIYVSIIIDVKNLNRETWITLIQILVGITDSLMNTPNPKGSTNKSLISLRSKFLECLFGALYMYPYPYERIWTKIFAFSAQWSVTNEFTVFWCKVILKTFSKLLKVAYNVADENTFNEPIIPFIPNELISSSKLPLIFYHTLKSLNYKSAANVPDNFTKYISMLYDISNLLVNVAISASKSKLFVAKYDASVFISLFGKYLSFFPTIEDPVFDPAVSINLNTLFSIIKNLDVADLNEIIIGLITSILLFVNEKHPLVFTSFLAYSNLVLVTGSKIAPFLAKLQINNLYLISIEPFKLYLSDLLCNSMTNGFISAIEICKDENKNIKEGFTSIWNYTKDSIDIFELLCFCNSFKDVISIDLISNLIKSNKDITKLLVIIIFISVLIRYNNNNNLIEEISSKNLLSQIVNNFIEIKVDEEDNNNLIIVILQMFYSFIKFNPKQFTKNKNNVNAYFDLINCLNKNLLNVKEKKHWFNSRHNYIKYLIYCTQILFMTGKIVNEKINEKEIIEKFKDNYKLNCFTIDDLILITSIENNKKLVLIIRGNFGKSIVKVKLLNNIKSFDNNLINKTDEIKNQKINEPKIKIGLKSPQIKPIDEEYLKNSNESFAKQFVEETTKWNNWSEMNFNIPNLKFESKRSKLIDFLITTGLLDSNNSRKIRFHKVSDCKSVINGFDQKEVPTVLPIPILHIMSNDINITNNYVMTESLYKFIQRIGNLIDIDETNSKRLNLPNLRCKIPTIQTVNHLVGFIAPEMAAEKEESNAIFDLKDKSNVIILFNETKFQLKPQQELKNKIVFVVTPIFEALYSVSLMEKVNNIKLPIVEPMVMSAKSIVFLLAVTFEQLLPCKNMRTNLMCRTKFKTMCEEKFDQNLLFRIAENWEIE